MRILIYHEALFNENHKNHKLLKKIIIKLKENKRIHIEDIENFEEFETAFLTRSYSLIISSKKYLKVSLKNHITNVFFTSIIILDENISPNIKEQLYNKKTNYIFELDKENENELLTKIFSIKILDQEKYIQFFNFLIDLKEKKVYINKIPNTEIRGKMFDIFVFLIYHQGITFSKEEIINAVYEEPEEVNENSVDTYLSTLKKNINSITDKFKMNVINKEGYNISLISNTIKRVKNDKY